VFATEYHYLWMQGRRVSSEDVLDSPLAVGVMTGPWWYLKTIDGDELYHTGRDPDQRRNLVVESSRHEKMARALADRHVGARWKVDRSGEPGSSERVLSPELREQLRDLGYAD
jgi:hypothetical protein